MMLQNLEMAAWASNPIDIKHTIPEDTAQTDEMNPVQRTVTTTKPLVQLAYAESKSAKQDTLKTKYARKILNF